MENSFGVCRLHNVINLMVQVIINADDCGYNPEVNASIDHALSVGAISSTTILANSDYLDEVHRMVECHFKASFGIHLNLTEGKSLTNPLVFRQRGITDENGVFIHGNSKRCPKPDKILAKAIYDEWDAQLDLLINKEHFAISHADGHHHCHTWAGLEAILAPLMKKYEIKKVRNKYYSPSVSLREDIKRSLVRCIEPIGRNVAQLYSWTHYYTYNKALRKAGIHTTDFFEAYDTMAPILKGMPIEDCTIELMCHPGLKEYDKEYHDILSNKLGIDNSSLKLISYREL